jgi:hypothetical protein
MNGTNIWQLKDLLAATQSNAALINGKYVPARPLGWTNIQHRLKAAWLVFTTRADAVVWPEDQ